MSLLCRLISEQSWMTTLTVGGDFPARFWRQILLVQRYYQTKEGRLVHESCFRMGWMQINSFPHRELSHEMGMLTCVQTPSTTSTRTSAPSDSREAIETSLLNAPGIVDSGVTSLQRKRLGGRRFKLLNKQTGNRFTDNSPDREAT